MCCNEAGLPGIVGFLHMQWWLGVYCRPQPPLQPAPFTDGPGFITVRSLTCLPPCACSSGPGDWLPRDGLQRLLAVNAVQVGRQHQPRDAGGAADDAVVQDVRDEPRPVSGQGGRAPLR